MKHPVGWKPTPTVDPGRAQRRPRPSWVTKDRQALEFQAGGHCGQTPEAGRLGLCFGNRVQEQHCFADLRPLYQRRAGVMQHTEGVREAW